MKNKIDMLRQMVDTDPENGRLWFLLGMECEEKGDLSEALRAYTQALRNAPDELNETILTQLNSLSSSIEAPPNSATRQELNPAPTSQPLWKITPTGDHNEEVISPYGLRLIHGGSPDVPSQSASRITFSDVGGLVQIKQAIDMKIIKPFMTPGLFAKFKKKIGGGILLYGPPGCGKTFIAKATAGECNASFINVHISDILGKYVGESEENLHAVFAQARSKKPCILFFDEIDTLGYSRAKSSSQVMRGVIDQFLIEMEGVNTDTDRILIIGATNTPWDVDSAFKRPGRFDSSIFVGPPDLPARAEIFRLKLAGRPAEPLNYELLAAQTELYSGADIENVIELAVQRVIEQILTTGVERLVTMEDVLTAIRDTRASTIPWLRTVKNYVKYANQDGQYDEVEQFLRTCRHL